MDLNEFRCFVSESGVDVWTWIDMTISLACEDHGNELKKRRDGIVQKLYASPAFSKCRVCDNGGDDEDEQSQRKKILDVECVNGGSSGFDEDCMKKEKVGFDHNNEISANEAEESDDDDDEKRKIMEIKLLLVDDHNQQSERCLIELLQKLVDMNTTFKDLKETDIGRHVTKLRKHSSGEVRRLVKILVKKWKDTVDEWVKLNTPPEEVTQCDDYEAHHVNGEAEHTSVSCNLSSTTKGKLKKMNTSASTKHRLENDQEETQHVGEAKKPRTGPVSGFCNNIPKTKNNNNNNGIITSTRSANFHAKYW